MIDTYKRQVAKKLIEGFLNGLFTNDDVANDYPRDKRDPALAAIYERLWFLWDDRGTYKLTHRDGLEPANQALIDRSIAFLDSDLEYLWPQENLVSIPQVISRLLHLKGLELRRSHKWRQSARGSADTLFWPFASEDELKRATGQPTHAK